MTTLANMTKAEKEHVIALWKTMCREDFAGWFQSAGKIKVKDPAKPLAIPVMNVAQQEVDDAIEWCDANKVPARIIVLKARQWGISSYAVARGYHRARSTAASCAILGDDKNTTGKLMEMWRRFGENDAMDAAKAWGNTPTNPHQPSWMTFTHGAALTLETANDPRAGQGTTLHFLHSSETASYRASGHSTGEDVFSAILGCVPELPGTLVIVESTAQGQTGIFYTTVQGAVTLEERKAGKRGNGYILIFAPWFKCDDYQFDGQDGRRSLMRGEAEEIMQSLDEDEERLARQFGADVITPERLAWRRHKIDSPDCGGDIRKFRREYPSTIEEAFQSTGSQFFDPDGLLWQEQQITPSTADPKVGDIVLDSRGRGPVFLKQQNGRFRVWEHPEEGESYVLCADFRVGRQSAGSSRELDTNAVMVIRAGRVDPRTGQVSLPRVVASVRDDDRSDTDIILQRILALHRLYGDCIVVPEVNNSGNIVWQMQQIGITNIWSQPTGANGQHGSGKTSHVLGFNTNVQTRRQILDNMAAMTREQAWICSCPTLLKQMRAFVRNQDGKPEAAAGYHDDFVMSAAIGLFALPRATVYRGTTGQSANNIDRYRLERSAISPLGA